MVIGAAGIAFMLALPQVVSGAPPVTFAHDIAAILYQHCAPCHQPEGAAPFSLLSYDDAKGHARQIEAATRSRAMPPWLPEKGYGDFQGELRLSDEEISRIVDWVSQGAPEGPVSEIPPAPVLASGWQLGPPDMILDAEQPFLLPATGPDLFWNFVFTPSIKTTRYVRAIEIRPGNRQIVHHANLLVDRTHWARSQELAPGVGFPGMDPPNERSVFDPDDGHFLFWKPGNTPYIEPDGLAWRLDPSNNLVLNTHLRPSGKPDQARPSIGLYFTDQPQKRFPMLVQLEHDGKLDIPPGDPDFLVSDDFRLPLDVEILAVYPHAHYLGNLLEGYATLPGGERKWLIRIPHWDPDWQAVYHYRQPVFLPKGTVISMRYHYDNSAANPRNPSRPPKRVLAGDQSTDEMGHLWLQILPSRGGDRRLELEEAVMRHRLEKYPDDFRAHFRLGGLLLARLDARAALPMAEAAVRIQPEHPEARNLLGAALDAVGRTAEAAEQFQLAVHLRPDYVNAQFNLANAQVKLGKVDEAIENFHHIEAAYPNDALTKDRLAKALEARAGTLSSQGKLEDAAACYRELVTLEPGDFDTRTDFATLLVREGKLAEAVEQYDKALAIDPSNAAARKDRESVLGKFGR